MDNGKFMNAYLEVTNSTVHEYLNNVLLLKAQLKSAEEIIVDKDKQINSLTEQLTLNNNTHSELDQLRSENATLKNKSSQVDTFANQIIDMKKMIIERDEELQKLQKKPVVKKKNTIEQPPKPTDDF